MTTTAQYESLGVIHADAGVETTLLRGGWSLHSGEPQGARAGRGGCSFKSAAGEQRDHAGFEPIVDAGRTGRTPAGW